MPPKPKDSSLNKVKIFCALDTPDLGRAIYLAQAVGPVTHGLKLGMEFFNSFGPQGVEKVRNAYPEAALFIDLKFHDIPNTVAATVKTISMAFEPAYLNVHASGGLAMMEAARDACTRSTKLLAVTVLTSMTDEMLADAGQVTPVQAQVQKLARLTKTAGLSGVVCSAHEISMIRDECGKNFVLMVPGIRPEGSEPGDQKRVMTPGKAMLQGATHLVIGRPITASSDPQAAALSILKSLEP